MELNCMNNYRVLDRLRTIHKQGINLNSADEFIDLQREACGLIDTLDKGEYIVVLYGRYILFETWEVIAAELGVTSSYAHRIHKKALEEFMKQDATVT